MSLPSNEDFATLMPVSLEGVGRLEAVPPSRAGAGLLVGETPSTSRELEEKRGEENTQAEPRLLSHYKILRLLGQGGMGKVYQAEDTRLERVVALKVMLPELSDQPSAQGKRIKINRDKRSKPALFFDGHFS